MKIAILIPTFSKFSGIDRVVEMQANRLLKEGNIVDIYCLYGDIKIDNKNCHIYEIKNIKNQFFERIYRLFFFLDIFIMI